MTRNTATTLGECNYNFSNSILTSLKQSRVRSSEYRCTRALILKTKFFLTSNALMDNEHGPQLFFTNITSYN